MLSNIVDNSITDKNTTHSYLDLYQKLLVNKKHTAKNILEIGVHSGGSIKLWRDFFDNAIIHGLDNDLTKATTQITNDPRIILYGPPNAYDESFFKSYFLNKNIKFDMLLDDGPHTLDSMKSFIKLYSQVMTDDGILIIEDIQEWNWIEILKNIVPNELKKYINVYDLRKNKGRYDDIVLTIDKSQ
jgi:hypothetical protein